MCRCAALFALISRSVVLSVCHGLDLLLVSLGGFGHTCLLPSCLHRLHASVPGPNWSTRTAGMVTRIN